ncbi:hypothetical protein ACSX1A_08415 [Pontibacter sp. MBLB2868]|uniref:hypothetical protein n=1 Tax=Pontibacter sp. MBLB2868 TaxID=3451555 RepID=UPI003F74F373
MSFNGFFYRLLGLGEGLPTCKALKRSATHQAAFTAWVKAQVYLNWTGPFFKAYHYQKAHFPSKYRVQLITDEHRKGATFFYDPSIGAENFQFLFDLLKERVLQLGYSLRSSDEQQVRHKRYTEAVERYFMLPPASDVPGSDLCNQLYGNIIIELIKVNKHPGYIRFTANSYADVYFSEPLPFLELLEKVLQPDEQSGK